MVQREEKEGTGEWQHKISVNSGSPVDAFFEITRPFLGGGTQCVHLF